MRIGGRAVIDREEMARVAGVSKATVTAWMHRGDAIGFPPRHRVERKDWVVADEFRVWLKDWNERHAIGKQKPIAAARQPNELLKPSECAKAIGVTPETFRSYIKMSREDWEAGRPALLPRPDDVEELPSGRVRRRWKYRTIRDWHTRSRPGKGGRPTGTGRPVGSPKRERVAGLLRQAIENRQVLSVDDVADELGVTVASARRLLHDAAPEVVEQARLVSRDDMAARLPGDVDTARERVKWHMRQPGAPAPVAEIGNKLWYDPADAEVFIGRIA